MAYREWSMIEMQEVLRRYVSGTELQPHQVQIRRWLGEGLRLTKIHRRLQAHGVTVSYSSL